MLKFYRQPSYFDVISIFYLFDPQFLILFILNDVLSGKNDIYMAEYNGRSYIFKMDRIIMKRVKREIDIK